MTTLRNSKVVAFDIAEGIKKLTSNCLWGNSSWILIELERNLVSTQNKIQSEVLTYDDRDGSEEINIKLQRIEHALSVLHDYFKKKRMDKKQGCFSSLS